MEDLAFINREDKDKHVPSNNSTAEGSQNLHVEDDRYSQHSQHLLKLFPKEVNIKRIVRQI